MITMLAKGIINIEMKNILPSELQKLRSYFIQLTELQIHRFGPGKIILHFDKDKNLIEIEIQQIAWRRKKHINA